MKQLFPRLFKKLQQLFDFHQPRFRHLDCIDLVLENKLLLLLSWNTVHANKIRIRPGKTVYHQSISAAICKLPIDTKAVDIILHNAWRSTKVTFRLKRIAVDHQTLRYIDEHFLAGPSFYINRIQPDFITPIIQLKKLQPQISFKAIVPAFNISINQFQLNDYVP